jgi:Domain of unknown function (DUF4136)
MKTIALALVGVLAAACSATNRSGPEIETAASLSAPFAEYRTFSFGFTQDPPRAYQASARSLEVEHRMRELFASALTQKGYVEDGAKPDFVVRFGAGTRRVEMATYLEPGAGHSADDDAFTFGKMNVDIYDASTKIEVWSGSVVSNIDLAKPIDNRVLERAVQGVLATFPARSAAVDAPAQNPLAATGAAPVDQNGSARSNEGAMSAGPISK